MRFSRRSRPFAALLLAALAFSPLGAPAQEGFERPLPEARAFLDEVRQHLHSDQYLLDSYTFTECLTKRQFDAKGNVKKLTREVYEVYPSSAPQGRTYRKLVERDGQALAPEKLAKQDRDHDKKLAKRDKVPEEKRRARRAEGLREEQEIVEELFRIYEIAIAARETIEGRSAILVTFTPKEGVKASNRVGKILQKFAGKAWVDEEDLQIVRTEAELLDTFSYGLGVLARFYEGATASFSRRKVNGEVWLPAEVRFTGRARIFLKGARFDTLSEYSDYKKFDVATESAIEPEKTSR